MDDKLYVYLNNKKFELVDENVSIAFLILEMTNIEDSVVPSIYYLKQDGSLWYYKPNLILNKFDNIDYGEQGLKNGDFELYYSKVKILNNVKTFGVTETYLVFTKLDDKLYMLPRDIFDPFMYSRFDKNMEENENVYGYPNNIKPKNEEYSKLHIEKIYAHRYGQIVVVDFQKKMYRFDYPTFEFKFETTDVVNASPFHDYEYFIVVNKL